MKTHHITIYGPGCMRCNTLAENTKQALSALSERITLSKESDPMKMIEIGVLNTPALALDGKVLLSGRVPSSEEIRALLMKSLGSKTCRCIGERECRCGNASQAPQSPCCGGKQDDDEGCNDGNAEKSCGCGDVSCRGGMKGGSGLKTLPVILVL